MGITRMLFNSMVVNRNPAKRLEQERDKILKFLYDIQALESKLWGVIIKDINANEEKVLEDSNHLIYLYSRGKHQDLHKILKKKDFKAFLKDLNDLKKDFNLLKKTIKDKDRLKLLLSNFTIKLVDARNYDKFKDVFLLERMLYDVLDNQDDELAVIIGDISKMKVDTDDEKFDVFLQSLKNIREILAGHIETHNLFEDERGGFSNVSNIIYALIKIFKQDLD